MELLISAIIAIAVIEAYAWLPSLSNWVLAQAVRRLRKDDQAWCREDWSAGLEALPNTLVRLVHAISFIPAAHRINNEFFENELSEMDAVLTQLNSTHAKMVVVQNENRVKLSRSEKNAGRRFDDLLTDIRIRATSAPDDKTSNAFQNLATSTEELAHQYFAAMGRAVELLIICSNSTLGRLSEVEGRIRDATAKRNQIAELLNSRNLPLETLDVLMSELASDLRSLADVFEDDKWGDDESLAESKRILALIVEAFRPLMRPSSG